MNYLIYNGIAHFALFLVTAALYYYTLKQQWHDWRVRKNLTRKYMKINDYCPSNFYRNQHLLILLVSCFVAAGATVLIGYINSFSFIADPIKFLTVAISNLVLIMNIGTNGGDFNTERKNWYKFLSHFTDAFIQILIENERTEKCHYAKNQLNEIFKIRSASNALIKKIEEGFYIHCMNAEGDAFDNIKACAAETIEANRGSKQINYDKLNNFFNNLFELDDCRIDEICEVLTYEKWDVSTKNYGSLYADQTIRKRQK